ncbi:hypothetical protein E3N88_30455 [Mikania micrantha]|uniref:Uncharacterized protein n=1 Tax=Mikania micrantha TaxID=192012 RepID=A0A5N6MLN0_9ASTR|nr:hypothetical protein E3N88_30455 [Mikania micrantha]
MDPRPQNFGYQIEINVVTRYQLPQNLVRGYGVDYHLSGPLNSSVASLLQAQLEPQDQHSEPALDAGSFILYFVAPKELDNQQDLVTYGLDNNPCDVASGSNFFIKNASVSSDLDENDTPGGNMDGACMVMSSRRKQNNYICSDELEVVLHL